MPYTMKPIPTNCPMRAAIWVERSALLVIAQMMARNTRPPSSGKPGIMLKVPSKMIPDRKSTRLNSSHEWISYAVFCLKKNIKNLHDLQLDLPDADRLHDDDVAPERVQRAHDVARRGRQSAGTAARRHASDEDPGIDGG